MDYEIDEDYPFEYDNFGLPYMPKGMTEDGHLYVLPNGKYLPHGCYVLEDGSSLIYEPAELSPLKDLFENNLVTA